MLVEGCVLLELKAVRRLDSSHEAQLLNYLRATEIEVGLLLNFGLKAEFKRLTSIMLVNQSVKISVYIWPHNMAAYDRPCLCGLRVSIYPQTGFFGFDPVLAFARDVCLFLRLSLNAAATCSRSFYSSLHPSVHCRYLPAFAATHFDVPGSKFL
jgi:hypothetical protein